GPAPPTEVQVKTPRVNCPEKVIICLDLAEEMALPKLESFNGSKTNALNISQKMIEMFVRTKHKIDKCHEFALVVVNNDATWFSGSPPDPREVCSCLYDLETVVCKSFSIPPPVGLGQGKIELPVTENVQTIPPPYVVRTILVFGRPGCQPQFSMSEHMKKMLQCPYFFFDVVYIHNGVEEKDDETSWKEMYAFFSSLDTKGTNYKYEVSLTGPAVELHNCMAKLLAHPLQRPFQTHAAYSLLEEDERPEIEATDGKRAIDLVLEQGNHAHVQILRDSQRARGWPPVEDLGGPRRSLSFLTEDGTEGSISSRLSEDSSEAGPLSSTRRSLLEELELGGGPRGLMGGG
ncbi:PREDICTED: BRISC and BRCA1-A complex member 1, partial [Aptenodytes forsteri]|uniref:BRISC and BRCA1-A complex member 1 n=1 Tax=Aptenodytes forsteri TaxID=9233 RepID=UPI000905B92D